MRRRGRELPRSLVALGWLSAATLVTLSADKAPRRAAPLGPPTGHLADGLPPLPAPVVDSATPPAGTPSDVAPASPQTPRVIAELEAALTGRESVARIGADADTPAAEPNGRAARARRGGRSLPRPFAELRTFASPLIMPRLTLPRVLEPDFPALRALAARARPGEPVRVKLTAYCLSGTTRRGTRTRPGIVAADPRLFPMARHVELYAAGRFLGRFRVEDTGGGVRGPHIDIWTPDCADARRFGTRPGVASLVGLGRD